MCVVEVDCTRCVSARSRYISHKRRPSILWWDQPGRWFTKRGDRRTPSWVTLMLHFAVACSGRRDHACNDMPRMTGAPGPVWSACSTNLSCRPLSYLPYLSCRRAFLPGMGFPNSSPGECPFASNTSLWPKYSTFHSLVGACFVLQFWCPWFWQRSQGPAPAGDYWTCRSYIQSL